MPTCPSNHESQTTDFCSVCGIEMIAAAPGPVRSTSTAPAVSETCPICQTLRSPDGGDFCEECGYNFRSGTLAPSPAAPVVESVPPEPPTLVLPEVTAPEVKASAPEATVADPETAPVSTAGTAKPDWEVVVSVVPDIRGTTAADAPTGQPDRLYPLDRDKTIGRRSVTRKFTPDIDLTTDTAVSHQQAKLARQANGEVALIDLDSANGTLLNKVKIAPNVLHLLKDGDVIAMGGWTKIVIRKIPH